MVNLYTNYTWSMKGGGEMHETDLIGSMACGLLADINPK